MTSDAYASVNGERVTTVRLTVGNTGPWIAEVDFEGEPPIAGRVTLKIGSLELSGTVVVAGTFAMQRRARIVAGAGGWSSAVEPKAYHNDAGVKARVVAEDAARVVGEELGDFVPTTERIGRDYARQAGPAARVLEDVIGGVAWWVDYEGKTQVGPRPATDVDAKAYTVLAWDPRDRIATLAVDDLAAVRIGATLRERLDAPAAIRSMEVRVTPDEMRVFAWCGGSVSGDGYLAGLMRSIIRRSTDGQLFGHYRYRVVRMAGERVELQAVRRIVGLPDLLPLSCWPGVAGAHAELRPGAEVLVGFVEGDRAQPVVLAFAGADGPGFVPTQLTLGGTAGSPVARQGDLVDVIFPASLAFSGFIGGVNATGVITATPMKTIGVITGGSSKVRVAT